MISVIVPTVAGREEHLARCLDNYAATTENYEVLVIPDKDVCGAAWCEGAERARGTHLHFSADDLYPHAGWADAAVGVCERGFLPAPRILNSDGTLQSCGGSDGWETEHPTGEQTDFSRIPFLHREQWERIAPHVVSFLRDRHYFTDNAVSTAAARFGIRTGVHRDYLFTHTLAEQSRGAGMTWEQRMIVDGNAFAQWRDELSRTSSSAR